MAELNSQFEFLDMDIFESTDTEIYSLFLNNEDVNNTQTELEQPVDDLFAQPTLNPFDSLPPIDINDTPMEVSATTPQVNDTPLIKQGEQSDIQLLLEMNRQLHNRLQQQHQLNQQLIKERLEAPAAGLAEPTSIDNSGLVAQLISPASPGELPMTPVSPQSTSISSTNTDSIAKAAATADAQIAVLIDSSRSAAAAAATATNAIRTSIPSDPIAVTSTSTKRPSPEPMPVSRKLAKTESTKPAVESITTAAPTINTTLSAATLQFLLQQQIQTPLVPHLFTGKLSKAEIEETLSKLLESTKHLLESQESKEESPIDESEDECERSGMKIESDQPSAQTHGLKTQPGIKTDDIPSSTDLKKMTSKERRQLRNKISARNFRVRRKEYIGQLEGQVEQHRTEARHLREAVTIVHEENKRLKEELEEAKRQLSGIKVAPTSFSASISSSAPVSDSISTPASPPPSPSTPTTTPDLSLAAKSMLNVLFPNPRSPFTQKGSEDATLAPKPLPSVITYNPHKDVPNSASIKSIWNDTNPTFVLRTIIPEINIYDHLQFGPKPAGSKDDEMWDRPWLDNERVPKELSKTEINPFFLSSIVYEFMQTFAMSTLESMPSKEVASLSNGLRDVDSRATAQGYESDRQMAVALCWEEQQRLTRQNRVKNSGFDIDGEDEIPIDLDKPLSSILSSLVSAEDDWLYESYVAVLVAQDRRDTNEQIGGLCGNSLSIKCIN